MKDAYINGKIIDGTKEMQVKEGYAIREGGRTVGSGRVATIIE